MTCAVDDKHDVEWAPAEYKHSHYNSHRQRDFTLFVQFLLMSFLLSSTDLQETNTDANSIGKNMDRTSGCPQAVTAFESKMVATHDKLPSWM